MKILLCTIMRDTQPWLGPFVETVNAITEHHDVWLSIYENDSTDGTGTIVSDTDWLTHSMPGLKGSVGTSHVLKTQKFGSTSEEQRVKNLAAARNNCIDQALEEFDEEFDVMAWWDMDAWFHKDQAVCFLEAIQHYDWDIVSPLSVLKHNRQCLYDTWATRWNDRQQRGPTNRPAPAVHDVWSTFNVFCVYRWELVKAGVRFGWYNERFKTHDCDTTVVCENARKKGFNKIKMDARFIALHQH